MAERQIPEGFGDVDGSGAVAELVGYLRYVNDLPWVRASKDRSLEALELGPGMRVLDAGSGVGFDACRFAERVGPGGTVLGIDTSREMVGRAERLRPAGLPQLSFEIGDAAAIDLPDGTFDAVHCERLLQVHPAPRTGRGRARPCALPGGSARRDRARLGDPRPRSRRSGRGPPPRGAVRRGLSRRLDRPETRAVPWRAGLVGVRVEPATVVLHDLPIVLKAMNIGPFLDGAVAGGTISANERAALLRALQDANANATFLFAMTTFRAVGRRPAAG